MSGRRADRTGYEVTIKVFVPAERAEKMVDQLDEQWRIEKWTPEAAAAEVARRALAEAGLHRATSIDTHEVHD